MKVETTVNAEVPLGEHPRTDETGNVISIDLSADLSLEEGGSLVTMIDFTTRNIQLTGAPMRPDEDDKKAPLSKNQRRKLRNKRMLADKCCCDDPI